MLKYVYWHIIIYFVPNLFPKILLIYKSLLQPLDELTRKNLTVSVISRYKKLATRDQLYLKVKETKRQGRIAHHHADALPGQHVRT